MTIIRIFGIVLVFLFFVSCTSQDQVISEVCISSECFTVEVADSPAEQQQGLMGREQLEPHASMLFVFNVEKQHSFWMKDTLIPLDMIWIDSNKSVVGIVRNAQSCEMVDCPAYNPGADALYVLELAAGSVDAYSISLGDAVEFRYE